MVQLEVLVSERQRGALAVALYGVLVSGSFPAGMRASILISAALLVASSAAALALPRSRAGVARRRRAENSAAVEPPDADSSCVVSGTSVGNLAHAMTTWRTP
jgi:hypothetical protein